MILIFFVLIALVGVLALTLDYGFVILARRQMQTGVNAAALEGLRDIDGEGRENARDLMRNIYDDDLDPSENETTIGAGIDKSLIQGDGFRSVFIGAGDGLPTMFANRSQYIYRPKPELNLDNEVHGDFVHGDFVPGQQPKEYPTYDRDGFTPSPNGNAFLSRLRRTHNPNGLDQVPGVSSSGGGLPLIIGHLAWFAATDPKASYSIRRDGVTVRATAISTGKPANAISPALPLGLLPGVEMLGATPFIVDAIVWDGVSPIVADIKPNGVSVNGQVRLTGLSTLASTVNAAATTLQVSSASGFPIRQTPFRIRINNELLTVLAVDASSSTTWIVERGAVGTTPASHDAGVIALLHAGRRVGEVVTLTSERPQNTDLNLLPGKSVHAYVPLFADINGQKRIVGFGLVNWTWANTQLTINPAGSVVASQGASVTSFAAGLERADLDELLRIQSQMINLLLAPTHVRATR